MDIIQFIKANWSVWVMKDTQNGTPKTNFGINSELSASEIAWKMFKKSGNINYYRLYSDLKKKDD